MEVKSFASHNRIESFPVSPPNNFELCVLRKILLGHVDCLVLQDFPV